MEEEGFTVYEDNIELIDAIERTISSQRDHQNHDDAFHLMDLGYQVRAVDQWRQLLPGVTPFYAVKVNPDPVLIGLFAKMNFGFDCASKGEIDTIINLGVPPSRIIFANTRKQPSHLLYASTVGVEMTTFDDRNELVKISKFAPNMKLVLRISVDGFTENPFDEWTTKFGCPKRSYGNVLGLARKLNLNVIGVSFHIGSFETSSVAFALAIEESKRAFQEAKDNGFSMKLLDIGGGMPPKTVTDLSVMQFEETSDVIRDALREHFGDDNSIKVIAEPGSYFTVPSTVLVTCIIGERRGDTLDGVVPEIEYFINDGVFGSFRVYNFLPGKIPVAKPVARHHDKAGLHKCRIWGQTLAGSDLVLQDCELPDMETGAWLYFPDQGAYASSMASTFNGFHERPVYRFMTETMRKRLNEIISDGGFGKTERLECCDDKEDNQIRDS